MERPEIGPWSVVKNDILEEYSKSYLTIMHKQSQFRDILYVDAFAGATENIERSTNIPMPGSAKRALSLNPGFTEYYFFDKDEARVADLNSLAVGRSNVVVMQGDGNMLTRELAAKRLQYDQYRRALVFLDPYGMDLDWETVRLLGETKSADVAINFPIMDINRNSVRRNESTILGNSAHEMTRLWGSDEWRASFYGPHPNLSIWDEQPRVKKVKHIDIVNAYRNRLMSEGGYKDVTKPLLMPNKTGAPLYYILMASNNSTAIKIMNHILDEHRKRMAPQSLPLWTDD